MNLIVSSTKSGIIGLNDSMLWNISSDIERYKKITKGGILIMGNTTYKSLRKKRLPYHYNIVITKTKLPEIHFNEPLGNSHVMFVTSIEEAIDLATKLHFEFEKEIFVIGGKSIYEQFEKTNLITKVYHTIVNKDFYDNQKYTTFIPNVEGFKLIHNEILPENYNQSKTNFRIYEKN